MEDAALVERAAAGDDLAIETMVRRHTDAGWRLARANLRDDVAAEQAVGAAYEPFRIVWH